MLKIGLISDTHGWWDDRYAEYFAECDEIWHAGDIGSIELADRFEAMSGKRLRFVTGNIDGHELRLRYPEHQRFEVEGVDVWITPIGGYPGKYAPEVAPLIFRNPPRLFISGHSHILKVLYDKTLRLLHLNPGAAGKQGFHKTRTLMRFVLDAGDIRDLEVVELADKK